MPQPLYKLLEKNTSNLCNSCVYIALSSNGGTPKSSKVRPCYYWNLWFWGSPSLRTPIYVYIYIYIYVYIYIYYIINYYIYIYIYTYITGWWFGTFFPYIGKNHPNWLYIFQSGSNHQPDNHTTDIGHIFRRAKRPHLLAQACFLGLRQLGESQAPATKSGLPIGVHGKNLGKQWENRKSTRP